MRWRTEVKLIPVCGIAPDPDTLAFGAANLRHGARVVGLRLPPVGEVIACAGLAHVDVAGEIADGVAVDAGYGLAPMRPNSWDVGRRRGLGLVVHSFPQETENPTA